eukprot:gnl/Spiro4/546_TR307_c0_g1_i1.p1 gnl/Spiro4/546_TR307_c0_g1~~gnl/Spiro4/546_TR307_c0_g1_i1.p1  ORF type:complete len:520 (-),score=159.38 gnl/Spiro4/546_TR307_c0_g1_i1:62-1585(-)
MFAHLSGAKWTNLFRPSLRSFSSAAAGSPTSRTHYENPLTGRYSSKEMSFNWSPQKKFSTWRRLWLALAQAERELGLDISEEQLNQMRAHLDDINFDVAEAQEKLVRHDVMSHVHAFGEQCPAARPIIHLGATSCYVGDNTDLIQMRDGLGILRGQMLALMQSLKSMALQHRAVPTLGFTHYQPAQLTTVGKRATLWLQDFLFDYQQLVRAIDDMPFLGAKGTTGTQASFLSLFDNNHEKVRRLDARVTELMGFKKPIPVSGQTYTRKIDYLTLQTLAGVAASAHKMAVDIRLLMNLKELDEPFETKQIGSSAMPYKRNPMRCERICSLSRFVMNLVDCTAHTHSQQWFERTLDDSAQRRLTLPEAFLCTDVVLSVAQNVISGIVVWPHVIHKHIMAELPFMVTENILMHCVKAGGDRQELHEAIREHSMVAGRQVKDQGLDNDMVERLEADPRFKCVHGTIRQMLNPSDFIGRAPQQVEEFIKEEVDPVLTRDKRFFAAAREGLAI